MVNKDEYMTTRRHQQRQQLSSSWQSRLLHDRCLDVIPLACASLRLPICLCRCLCVFVRIDVRMSHVIPTSKHRTDHHDSTDVCTAVDPSMNRPTAFRYKLNPSQPSVIRRLHFEFQCHKGLTYHFFFNFW